MRAVISSVAVLGLLAAPIDAGPCISGSCNVVRRNVVQRNVVQKNVVVKNAVNRVVTNRVQTIGVPLALNASSFYSYNNANSYGQGRGGAVSSLYNSLSDTQLDSLAERIAERIGAGAGTSSYNLVAKNCAKCHSGAEPKGGFSIEGELDCDTRLNMISRLITDDPEKRMPKGKDLNEKEFVALLRELAPTQ